MLRTFRRFRRAIRFALVWSQAREACVRKNYAKSYSLLQSIYRLYGLPMPSDRLMYDVNLLTGNVALKSGEYDVALDAARIAIRQISESSELNSDEKDYLTFYGVMIVDRCLFLMQDQEAPEARVARDSSSLRRENLRSGLEEDFPIEVSSAELQLNRAQRCTLFRERCPHCGACGIRRPGKLLFGRLRCAHCMRKVSTSLVGRSLFWGVGSSLWIPILLSIVVGEWVSWLFIGPVATLAAFAAICVWIPVGRPER